MLRTSQKCGDSGSPQKRGIKKTNTSLKLTVVPEKQWLEDDAFPFGFRPFFLLANLLVAGSVYAPKCLCRMVPSSIHPSCAELFVCRRCLDVVHMPAQQEMDAALQVSIPGRFHFFGSEMCG